MWQRIVGGCDLVLAALIAVGGLGLMLYLNQKLDAAAVAALAGALFGGAAVLVGNWINRRDTVQRVSADLVRRRASLKTMIGAELVNVVAGHMGAKDILDAAIISMRAGGHVGDRLDMARYMPREMPFTDGLGVEILALDQQAIDALATLRSNLAITRMSMAAITDGRERFGLLQCTALGDAIRQDMAILATTFACIAPTRQLALPGEPAEPATEILRRLALPLDG
jgi:hypothetical protein